MIPQKGELHKEVACENQKIDVLSKVFLCSAIIIVYLNLHYNSVILRNLTSESGVENNPGPQPFAIREAVQTSHRQGGIRCGSNSAGKQCTANAYFTIIFSLLFSQKS